MTATQVLNLQVHLKAALIVHKPNYWVLMYLQKQHLYLGLLPLYIVTTEKGVGNQKPLILHLS